MDAAFSHAAIDFICWALAGLVFMMGLAMTVLILDSLAIQDADPEVYTGAPNTARQYVVTRSWFRFMRAAR